MTCLYLQRGNVPLFEGSKVVISTLGPGARVSQITLGVIHPGPSGSFMEKRLSL
jgi:hypothetical protein